MTKMFLFIFTSFLIVSCSNVANLRTVDNMKIFKESDPDKIEVYSTADASKPYIVIGEIVASADAGEDSEWPVELLKSSAATLGADAIVNLRLRFCQGYWTTGISATGTAVKFK